MSASVLSDDTSASVPAVAVASVPAEAKVVLIKLFLKARCTSCDTPTDAVRSCAYQAASTVASEAVADSACRADALSTDEALATKSSAVSVVAAAGLAVKDSVGDVKTMACEAVGEALAARTSAVSAGAVDDGKADTGLASTSTPSPPSRRSLGASASLHRRPRRWSIARPRSARALLTPLP